MTTWDDWASIRSEEERLLQCLVGVVRQQGRYILGEYWSLDEEHHVLYVNGA